MPGRFAAVVKNSTLGNCAIPNLNCVGLAYYKLVGCLEKLLTVVIILFIHPGRRPKKKGTEAPFFRFLYEQILH